MKIDPIHNQIKVRQIAFKYYNSRQYHTSGQPTLKSHQVAGIQIDTFA